MLNLDATDTETAAATSTTNELRRAWGCGYELAQRRPDLAYWMAPAREAALLAEAECLDADIEHPAGWAAWLMGFAAGLCEDVAQAQAVARAAQGKVDELAD